MRLIYTLVVKGDRFTAARAAADRGIPAIFLRENRYLSGMDTVLATRADVAVLAKWLAERHPLYPGEGFPGGTLLIYSEHRDATLASLKAWWGREPKEGAAKTKGLTRVYTQGKIVSVHPHTRRNTR